MLNTSNNSVIQIVKWFMLATLIGVVVGVLDAVFLKTLDAAIGARNKVPFFYLGMPVFLYVCMLLSRKTFPKDRDYTTDAVVNKINNYGPISFLSITKGFFLSILTMVTGGSAGKEAPCADVGAGVCSILARLMRMDAHHQRQ